MALQTYCNPVYISLSDSGAREDAVCASLSRVWGRSAGIGQLVGVEPWFDPATMKLIPSAGMSMVHSLTIPTL